AGATASVTAGGTASWYTHAGGLQLKAARGPVSLRAHTDRLQILADQQVQILSVADEIVVQAKERIELVGGDSAVVLDGSDIRFTTPGSFVVQAATHQWEGAGREAASIGPLPAGTVNGIEPTSRLQVAYSEALDLSDIPDAWLPLRFAAQVVARQSAHIVEQASRRPGDPMPLAAVTAEPQALRYWHSTGRGWVVEESVDEAAQEFDDEAEVDDD
ncbi:MAG: DUF2345 domain-containing protein, partial [Pseudomonadota bacterium]